MPAWIYKSKVLETVDLSGNQLRDWSEQGEDFRQCTIRHFDVTNNAQLGNPPVDFLRNSHVNKLVLVGCAVEKGELMLNMERNGVKEY